MRKDIRDLFWTMESFKSNADDICKFIDSINNNINSLKAQLETGALSNIDEKSKKCIKDYLEDIEYDVAEINGIVR